MKKIVLVLSLVMALSGCALDSQNQEEYRSQAGSGNNPKDKIIIVEKVLYLYEGEYIYVTIDEDNNVYDEDGNYLFNAK